MHRDQGPWPAEARRQRRPIVLEAGSKRPRFRNFGPRAKRSPQPLASQGTDAACRGMGVVQPDIQRTPIESIKRIQANGAIDAHPLRRPQEVPQVRPADAKQKKEVMQLGRQLPGLGTKLGLTTRWRETEMPQVGAKKQRCKRGSGGGVGVISQGPYDAYAEPRARSGLKAREP